MDLPDAASRLGAISKRSFLTLAQAVAVCEMSVQHVRGAGTVCKTTMQHLHGPFTVCEMTMQHLHSPFTVCGGTMQHLHSVVAVCETTMQHLRGLSTVCGGTMQHLHSPFTVCETTMQHLRGPFTVCETTMHPLHSLFGVSETIMHPLHSLFGVSARAMPLFVAAEGHLSPVYPEINAQMASECAEEWGERSIASGLPGPPRAPRTRHRGQFHNFSSGALAIMDDFTDWRPLSTGLPCLFISFCASDAPTRQRSHSEGLHPSADGP